MKKIFIVVLALLLVCLNVAPVAAGGEELRKWANTAGMTVEAFRKKFKEDAAGAVMAFIAGIERLKSSGKDVQPILDDLSLGGIRITDALLRAAGAQDLFTNAQQIAATAWKENNALSE